MGMSYGWFARSARKAWSSTDKSTMIPIRTLGSRHAGLGVVRK